MKRPDYNNLIEELESLGESGPLVVDEVQQERLQALMEKLLENMGRPQVAPVVTVNVPDFPKLEAPQVHVPAPVVHVQPAQKVLDWTFTFEHNPNGSIKSIRARATKE